MKATTQLIFALMIIAPLKAAAIDEPEFVVLERVGDIELRQYPELVVARTLVNAEFKKAGNIAFRRLAGYIFGANAEEQKIAMTAPVTMAPEPGDSGAYWISFFMPGEIELAELPEPENNQVQLTRMPATKMAVISYKGSWSEKKYNLNRQKLMSLVTATDWQAVGEPIWARYNSPFSLPFQRTNEVMIRIR